MANETKTNESSPISANLEVLLNQLPQQIRQLPEDKQESIMWGLIEGKLIRGVDGLIVSEPEMYGLIRHYEGQEKWRPALKIAKKLKDEDKIIELSLKSAESLEGSGEFFYAALDYRRAGATEDTVRCFISDAEKEGVRILSYEYAIEEAEKAGRKDLARETHRKVIESCLKHKSDSIIFHMYPGQGYGGEGFALEVAAYHAGCIGLKSKSNKLYKQSIKSYVGRGRPDLAREIAKRAGFKDIVKKLARAAKEEAKRHLAPF